MTTLNEEKLKSYSIVEDSPKRNWNLKFKFRLRLFNDSIDLANLLKNHWKLSDILTVLNIQLVYLKNLKDSHVVITYLVTQIDQFSVIIQDDVNWITAKATLKGDLTCKKLIY